MIEMDMGLVSEGPLVVPAVPAAPEDRSVPPLNSFATSGSQPGDEEMISLESEGCGSFEYSARKLQWLKDHFKDKFRTSSKCPKHKAESLNSSFQTDVEDTGSGSEAPMIDIPIVPSPPKRRFGTRNPVFNGEE
jgi:hypothetical protein